jgi:hypothetical protein
MWIETQAPHVSSEQAPVTTRVPPEQKEAWAEDAQRLEMSQSEFVRTMVQAGRRELGLEGPERIERSVEPDVSDATPGVEGLEDRVLDLLDERRARSWDELVEALTSGLEDRLDETLGELQNANRVRYSGRDGGYVLNE